MLVAYIVDLHFKVFDMMLKPVTIQHIKRNERIKYSKQGSKATSRQRQQASKKAASKRASKQTNKQESKQAREQANKQDSKQDECTRNIQPHL
jgi:hypothetical protein